MAESEWFIGDDPPFIPGAVFRVWTDGNVRTVRYHPEIYGMSLLFTDCKHPMQQAFCDRAHIQAWRLANE
jgi:hypothetical protein